MAKTYSKRIYKGRGDDAPSSKFSPKGQQLDIYQEWLSEARDLQGTAACLCKGKELPLSIVRRGVRCHTKKYPYTGAQHREDCEFYSRLTREAGQQAYTKEALDETNGMLDLALDVPLTRQEAREAEPAYTPASRPEGKTVKRNTMTLLGLLHLLWETSRYTEWHPSWDGKRNGPLMGYHLRLQAERIRVAGMTLSDLLLTPAQNKGRDSKRNSEAVTRADSNNTRLIVVAELDAWNKGYDTTPAHLPVIDNCEMPPLTTAPALWGALKHSFSRELRDWKAGARTIVIAYVDPDKARENSVRQAALMTVSPRFIPVDSGYEMKLEEKLYASERKFVKPLRYDAGTDEFLPDFYLTDLSVTEGKFFPLEVWGMDTEDYRVHREVKTDWYNNTLTAAGWWQWHAYRDPDNIPDLPAAHAMLARLGD